MIGMTEAASRTGKARQTIHKAIRQGRLSAQKDINGEWKIDPAELFRVYPPVSDVNSNQVTKQDTGLQQISDGLQHEIDLLRERLKDKDALIDELREDRNHWRQQATALLSAPKHQSLWNRLFGKDRSENP